MLLLLPILAPVAGGIFVFRQKKESVRNRLVLALSPKRRLSVRLQGRYSSFSTRFSYCQCILSASALFVKGVYLIS